MLGSDASKNERTKHRRGAGVLVVVDACDFPHGVQANDRVPGIAQDPCLGVGPDTSEGKGDRAGHGPGHVRGLVDGTRPVRLGRFQTPARDTIELGEVQCPRGGSAVKALDGRA